MRPIAKYIPLEYDNELLIKYAFNIWSYCYNIYLN